MIKKIDLHMHSTYSDGTNSVEEIFQIAQQSGLHTISITDHDSVSSYEEALMYSEIYGISYLPGIELSTDFDGKEIHILGYGINPHHSDLNEHLTHFIESRTLRNHQMLELLRIQGFHIQYHELETAFPNSILTRAHIARYLYQTNQLSSMQKAFQYIQDGGPCYVNRSRFLAEDAIHLIHSANGLAFVAHPTLYHFNQKGYDHLFETLTSYGLDGIESIYSTYSVSDINLMKHYAKKQNLLLSGGSDYHGENKPYIHMGKGRGQLFVPSTLLPPIYEKLQIMKETSE